MLSSSHCSDNCPSFSFRECLHSTASGRKLSLELHVVCQAISVIVCSCKCLSSLTSPCLSRDSAVLEPPMLLWGDLHHHGQGASKRHGAAAADDIQYSCWTPNYSSTRDIEGGGAHVIPKVTLSHCLIGVAAHTARETRRQTCLGCSEGCFCHGWSINEHSRTHRVNDRAT